MKVSGWLLLLLLTAGAAGCTYSPKIPAGIIECQPGGPRCPPPYQCLVASPPATSGVCGVAISGGDGAADFGGVGSGGSGAGGAGGTSAGGSGGVDLPRDTSVPEVAQIDTATAVDQGGLAAEVFSGDGAVDVDVPAAVDVAVPADLPAEKPDLAIDLGPPPAVCPSGRGPVMVNVGDTVPICIDSTEVTNLQYKAFLEDPAVTLLAQPEICRGENLDYAPGAADGGGLNVATRANHPVVNVDWCDAAAFCKWAGKRLCGAISGGPLRPGTALTPSSSQWAYACTRGGINEYPYGHTLNKAACNTGRSEFPIGTVPVASKPACVGGYDGLFDLVGNVEEWVDFCRTDSRGVVVCGLIGSHYSSPDAEAKCAQYYDADSMLDPWIARGFRCCGP